MQIGSFVTGLTGSGGAGAILWRWNETDASQFGADVYTPTTGTSVISFVSGQTDNYPTRLRLTLNNFTGVTQFPITDVLHFPARYMLYYKLHDRTGAGGGANDSVGWWFLSNGVGGASGFGWMFGTFPAVNAGRVVRNQAGVIAAGSTDPVIFQYLAAYPSVCNTLLVDCEPFPLPTATPRFTIRTQNFGNAANASNGNNLCQTDFAGSYTGWTGQTLDRLGIGARYTTAALTHTIDFVEMIVFAHPADW